MEKLAEDTQVVALHINYDLIEVALTLSNIKTACHQSTSYDEQEQTHNRMYAGLPIMSLPCGAAKWKQKRDAIFYIPEQHRQSILNGVQEIEQGLRGHAQDFLTNPQFISLRMRLELYKKALQTHRYPP